MADSYAQWFAPAEPHNVGGGTAMYRRCLVCHGHALVGSESAHIRWCDHHRSQDREALALQIAQQTRNEFRSR